MAHICLNDFRATNYDLAGYLHNIYEITSTGNVDSARGIKLFVTVEGTEISIYKGIAELTAFVLTN